MRALLPLLILAVLAAGCTERPRANPFDPANPATEGRPAGFAAVAGDREVRLAWLPAPASAAAGFRLYRRLEGETAFVPITGDLPGTASGVGDFGALNGRRHEYRLYYLFGGQIGGDPAEDHATPGPTRPWVADLGRRLLSRLSADGRRVASSAGGYFGPTAVAYDRDRQRVWVADTYDGRVVALANDLTLRVTIAGLSEPVAIALDSLNGDLWVCDQARDAVYHYDLDGNPRGPTSLTGIDTPISVAVDPQDGSLWVCERGGDRVRRYTRAGTPNGFVTLTAPSRVAVDSLSRDAWVTSFDTGLAVRIAPGAGIQDTVAFQGPIGVAVDGRRGRIWVADARAGTVVALRRSGVVEFTVGGLTRVREVTVDPRTGDGWATVPGTGEVVHIGGAGATAGQVLARAGGFSDPYGIAVDPGE